MLGLNESTSLADYTLGYTSDELVSFLADDTCDNNDFHNIFHNSSVESEVMNSIDLPLYDINSTTCSNHSQNFTISQDGQNIGINKVQQQSLVLLSDCNRQENEVSHNNNSQSQQQHSINICDIQSSKKLNNSKYHSVTNNIHINNSMMFNDSIDIIPPTSVDGNSQQSQDAFSVSLCNSSELTLQDMTFSDPPQDNNDLNTSCLNLFEKSTLNNCFGDSNGENNEQVNLFKKFIV